MYLLFKLILIIVFGGYVSLLKAVQPIERSIRDFNVLPSNSSSANTKNLQQAIEWASKRGAALFVEPTEIPYPVNGGLILRQEGILP